MSKIKKQNILPIPTQFDKSKLKTTGSLPNSETVNKTVANLTGKTLIETNEDDLSPTRPVGRPKKMPAAGRVPYNTMVHENNIMQLKILAAKKRVSAADLLEEALLDFFEKYKEF
jgi:hypothetical protein